MNEQATSLRSRYGGPRRIYLAQMIHRQVDWAIRFLGPDLVARNRRRADEVLCLLASTA